MARSAVATATAPPSAGLSYIRITDIKVGDQRANCEMDDIDELAESVRQVGILQPLILDQDMNVIGGIRRLLAASIAGLEEVPCFIRSLSKKQATQCRIIENNHRKDLDPIEEAELLQDLIRIVGGVDVAAAFIGRNKEYVRSRLIILEKGVAALRRKVKKGEIGIQKAALIAKLDCDQQQTALKGHIEVMSKDQVKKIVEANKKPLQIAEARTMVHPAKKSTGHPVSLGVVPRVPKLHVVEPTLGRSGIDILGKIRKKMTEHLEPRTKRVIIGMLFDQLIPADRAAFMSRHGIDFYETGGAAIRELGAYLKRLDGAALNCVIVEILLAKDLRPSAIDISRPLHMLESLGAGA